MTYDFHPDARLEYRQAAVFYEARQSGLGAAFTVEVEARSIALSMHRNVGARLNMTCADV